MVVRMEARGECKCRVCLYNGHVVCTIAMVLHSSTHLEIWSEVKSESQIYLCMSILALKRCLCFLIRYFLHIPMEFLCLKLSYLKTTDCRKVLRVIHKGHHCKN